MGITTFFQFQNFVWLYLTNGFINSIQTFSGKFKICKSSCSIKLDWKMHFCRNCCVGVFYICFVHYAFLSKSINMAVESFFEQY